MFADFQHERPRQLDAVAKRLAQLRTALGHELRHAAEVFSNPTLTSTEAVYMFYFYARVAPTDRDTFETRRAVRAGDAIRNDVGSYARRKTL